MKKLNLHEKYIRDVKLNKVKILGIQIAILVGFIAIWEMLAYFRIIDDFITSSPSRIIKTLISLAQQDLMVHVWTTLIECILGFIISTILGCLIAISLWWSLTLRRVLEPYIVILNSLPKIALGR